MQNVDIEHTRNFALIGHSGDGKTSLGESILHRAGAIRELGAVDSGSSVLNCLPEERDGHTATVSSHLYAFDWHDTHFTLVDTPGDPNYQGDTQIALQAMDGAILVVSAENGIKAGSEKMLQAAELAHVPVVAFINGLDREHADFEKAVASISEYDHKPVVVAIPVGEHADLEGVFDLIHMKRVGPKGESEIPEALQEDAQMRREELLEAAAEWDDGLLEKYLEEGDLTDDEVQRGVARGMHAGEIIPVLCGSAISEVGVDLMLREMIDLLPSPIDHGEWHGVEIDSGNETAVAPDPNGPFTGIIFKTIVDRYVGTLSVLRVVSGTLRPEMEILNATTDEKVRVGKLFLLHSDKHEEAPEAGPGDVVAIPKLKDVHTGNVLSCTRGGVHLPELSIPHGVISYAIQAHSAKEEEKVYEALSRLVEEDPSLHLEREPSTGEFLLNGMGELHLRTTVNKLHRIFGLDIELKMPKVPYRETITRSVKHVEGKLKKQTGGAGMFGVCFIDMEPLPRGAGFEFEEKVVGGAIPRGLIPAVGKGAQEACRKGPLAGYPLVDVKVRCIDGKYHSVDSNEMAFKLAGSFAVKAAAEKASPVLLEPLMKVAISIPDAHVGDVMGDLASRRGIVQSTEVRGHSTVIDASVPMSEILEYAMVLTSLTGGTGEFQVEFSHYDRMPDKLAQRLIEKANPEAKS